MTSNPEKIQERAHWYVLGPNQDARLASVGAGQVITGLELQLDSDAPFQLRSRAIRQSYHTSGSLTQNGLRFLSTRFTGQLGPEDYRSQVLINVSCEMVNFGQVGNPKPIYPAINYPANGIIRVDIANTGTSPILNLQLFFIGVKLFPWGFVQSYTYPEQFSSIDYTYQIPILNLGPTERRPDIPFTVVENDFVLRGGLATPPSIETGESNLFFTEVSIVLKDEARKPYMNDYIPLDVIFGSGGFPSVYPLGTSFIPPFGPGCAQPGLIYPEIYIPCQHTMWYSILRADTGLLDTAGDWKLAFVGAKVKPQ